MRALCLITLSTCLLCLTACDSSGDDPDGGAGNGGNAGNAGAGGTGGSEQGDGGLAGTGGEGGTGGSSDDDGGTLDGSLAGTGGAGGGGGMGSGTGACCAEHAEPGCVDGDIEKCVCDKLPECCTTTWDAPCVLIVEQRYCEKTDVRACVCGPEAEGGWEQTTCCSTNWSDFCDSTALIKCDADPTSCL